MSGYVRRVKTYHEKVCEICEKPFTTTRSTQKVCSRTCQEEKAKIYQRLRCERRKRRASEGSE